MRWHPVGDWPGTGSRRKGGKGGKGERRRPRDKAIATQGASLPGSGPRDPLCVGGRNARDAFDPQGILGFEGTRGRPRARFVGPSRPGGSRGVSLADCRLVLLAAADLVFSVTKA